MPLLLQRFRLLVAGLVVLIPFVAVSGAQAAQRHLACDDRSIEHPFAQWGDNADYFLIRQGALGSEARYDWDFGGGDLVAENNPYTQQDGDPSSLALNEGDSATSPRVCVTVNDPTMRFFVRNTGAATGTLKVEALYEDENYDVQSVVLGTLDSGNAGAEWAPTPTLELAAPLVELLDDGETPVWFRFTAEGDGSSWLVDDVYVDPYGKG